MGPPWSLRNPVNPAYVGYLFSRTRRSSWRDINALVASEAKEHGMQVFDLFDPTELPSADEADVPV